MDVGTCAVALHIVKDPGSYDFVLFYLQYVAFILKLASWFKEGRNFSGHRVSMAGRK